MKNKKSKIIVPALGLILLSTAASISGSVAWFTANRTAQVKAGEFAVVKTGDNLAVTLTGGVGIQTVDNDSTIKSVSVNPSYSLTDSSFDHTNTTMPYVVVPDVPRAKVLSNVPLNDGSLATNLGRGTNVYSAFTWNMTFTIAFAGSSTANQGLFLDLSDKATYMREKVTYDSEHIFTAADAGDYYTDEAFTTGKVTKASGDTIAAGTYYTLPKTTGRAFRIAFVPTAISGHTGGKQSKAYAKVWGANDLCTADTDEGKFVNGVQPDNPLAATAYGTTTISYNGTAYSPETSIGSGVFMKSGDTNVVPTDSQGITDTTAKANWKNYLGYFTADPGQSISITYTCVAWYEGTHPNINGETQDFEKIVASMKFGVCNLA